MNSFKIIFLTALIIISFSVIYAQQHVEKHLLNKKIEGLEKEPGTTYFLVFGDWGRNGQGDQQGVADWMGIAADQVTAKFVISTGDNFYCCGVASPEDYQWISSFEQIYRSHSLQIPWYVTLGNHDYQGNVQAELDYGTKNQRWKMPDRYFTNVIAGVRFVFIDTSPFIKEYYASASKYGDLTKQDTTQQLHWLDSVLSKNTKEPKIVVGHHPLYSLGVHGNETDLLTSLGKRFQKYHVSIYFAGHDHSLQSLKLKGDEVHYIISGGGSEYTTVKIDPAITKFGKGISGFIVVGQKEKLTMLYYIDNLGHLLFTESIELQGQ